MKNEFNLDELVIIKSLVESYMKEREGLKKYDSHKFITELLESVLEKTQDEINEYMK